MGLAIIDIVFLAIIAIFALRCGLRGIVGELMSMAALVLGLLSAIFFFRKTAELIRGRFVPDVKALPEIISFVAIFIVVFAVIKILETILKDIIERIQLGEVDRFLGFFFGVAEGVIIVCLLLFLIIVQPFVESDLILEGSFLADILMPFIIGTRKEFFESVAWFNMAAGGFSCV